MLKSFIDRTIFAITQEESRYTLSGAKFILDESGAKMVTTDGHRLAYVAKANVARNGSTESIDTLIPRKTLAELTKLTAGLTVTLIWEWTRITSTAKLARGY